MLLGVDKEEFEDDEDEAEEDEDEFEEAFDAMSELLVPKMDDDPVEGVGVDEPWIGLFEPHSMPMFGMPIARLIPIPMPMASPGVDDVV